MVIAKSPLRRVGHPSVEFHAHTELGVVDVVVPLAPPVLPPAAREPVGTLDPARIAQLEHRMTALAHIRERLGQRPTPAQPAPGVERRVQPRRRREPGSNGLDHPRDCGVEVGA